MKLFHLSDLHIGRRMGELSLIDDQRHILNEILAACDDEKPDGLLIAGDIYDKSLPSLEAVELLDEFFTELITRGLSVFVVSGNHDSPQRLSFGNKIFSKSGVYIAGAFDGQLAKKTLTDEFGDVDIYLMPFLKPAMVRPYYETEITSYEDAISIVINSTEIDLEKRNILVSHQFVTSGTAQPEISDSENISVGGLDNVDVSLFSQFDYVALGHIHKPQHIGDEHIRYAGSPLKYSFSESLHRKSLTVIELENKGKTQIRTVPLNPLRDMREIKGPLDELINAGLQDPAGQNDLIHATVTDEDEIYDVLGRLRDVYPNILRLDFENARTAAMPTSTSAVSDVSEKNPMELFSEFYKNQNNIDLTDTQSRLMETVFDEAGGRLL